MRKRVGQAAVTLPQPRPVSSTPSNRTRLFRWTLVAALLIVVGAMYIYQNIEVMLPPLLSLPEVSIRASTWDGTLIWFTITRNWKRLPFAAPLLAVRVDETLWGEMYLRNWDTVPSPFREEALTNMFWRYHRVLADPKMWDTMQPSDWDLVPQPIRALAYGHMAEYWSGYYDVGIQYEIPRRLMADTLHAILMAESWFEHRAVNESMVGNRDLGVAQASDFSRNRLRTLHRQGRVDVLLQDEDYFNPWSGTRFLAIWMNLMLDEVGGDLDLAIQAYYAGSYEALHGKGAEYLNSVKRYRRFLRTPADAAPAWKYLSSRDQERNVNR